MGRVSLFLAAALLAGCAGEHPGEPVYADNCAVCHGTLGLGQRETAIVDAADLTVVVAALTDEQILAAIEEGVVDGDGETTMYPIVLPPLEKSDLLDYLRDTFDR